MVESKTVYIEGGIPLVGSVKISGSRALALKLFYASIVSGEECVLSNVPQTKYVLDDIAVAAELGVHAAWAGSNKLAVNSRDLHSFTVPETAGGIVTSAFLVPALVHKFGKAVLPKNPRSDQFSKLWKSFGMDIKQDLDNLYIEAARLRSTEVTLPYGSRMLTDLAIITSLFVLGETTILNASTDVETDDLINFCNHLGVEIRRSENNSILVKGSGVFKSVNWTLPYDREEAAFFIIATLLTNGNTTLLDIERERLLPFINWLSKIGASYEFSGSDMRVWHNSGSAFEKITLTVAPHPGFITDFTPLAVLLACYSRGESVIIENARVQNLQFLDLFNGLGAGIEVERSKENVELHIHGPVKLAAGKISIPGLPAALPGLLYALTVEGVNELVRFEVVESGFENIVERLKSLGASITFDGL